METKHECIHGIDLQEWCEHCEIDVLNNTIKDLLGALKMICENVEYINGMSVVNDEYIKDGRCILKGNKQ